INGGAGGMQLPDGHPPIGGAQETEGVGTVVVRVKNLTPDGGGVADLPVTVQMYQNRKVVNELEGVLDAHGVLMLEDVP
ncbi:hypothetical protein R0K05_25310, partial [Planococcus sp. SIMBA_160]